MVSWGQSTVVRVSFSRWTRYCRCFLPKKSFWLSKLEELSHHWLQLTLVVAGSTTAIYDKQHFENLKHLLLFSRTNSCLLRTRSGPAGELLYTEKENTFSTQRNWQSDKQFVGRKIDSLCSKTDRSLHWAKSGIHKVKKTNSKAKTTFLVENVLRNALSVENWP